MGLKVPCLHASVGACRRAKLFDNLLACILHYNTNLISSASNLIANKETLPRAMSLVSGPGRAGLGLDGGSNELVLHVDKHVQYIQSLDTVRLLSRPHLHDKAHTLIA